MRRSGIQLRGRSTSDKQNTKNNHFKMITKSSFSLLLNKPVHQASIVNHVKIISVLHFSHWGKSRACIQRPQLFWCINPRGQFLFFVTQVLSNEHSLSDWEQLKTKGQIELCKNKQNRLKKEISYTKSVFYKYKYSHLRCHQNNTTQRNKLSQGNKACTPKTTECW